MKERKITLLFSKDQYKCSNLLVCLFVSCLKQSDKFNTFTVQYTHIWTIVMPLYDIDGIFLQLKIVFYVSPAADVCHLVKLICCHIIISHYRLWIIRVLFGGMHAGISYLAQYVPQCSACPAVAPESPGSLLGFGSLYPAWVLQILPCTSERTRVRQLSSASLGVLNKGTSVR